MLRSSYLIKIGVNRQSPRAKSTRFYFRTPSSFFRLYLKTALVSLMVRGRSADENLIRWYLVLICCVILQKAQSAPLGMSAFNNFSRQMFLSVRLLFDNGDRCGSVQAYGVAAENSVEPRRNQQGCPSSTNFYFDRRHPISCN